MRLDPFRIQILTLSIDSQLVLTLVGLVIAGLVFRQSARQAGFGLSTSHWWDLIFAAVVGGRLVWVVTHAEYYLRQPLQIVVILDGGLHAVGLALGAAYWAWRFIRTGDAPPWRSVVELVAIGVLTTYLFERVGCALTTCGTGPVSELPWAILRGDEWHTPMALEQVIVLAVALIVATETMRVRGAAFITMLAAFTLAEGIAFLDGRSSVEGLIALATLIMMYVLTSWYGPSSAWKGAAGQSSPS